jgi:GH25 family lysozyme M1 (1,4-beta-N-acetylmuramidase)
MDPRQLFADISSNNPGFHGHAYKSAGHRVIAIKATEGVTFTSPPYAAWAHAAHAAGLAVVHYHFARPELGQPRQQAQHFWATVKAHYLRGRDRLVADVETGSPSEAVAWLREYEAELATLAGTEPHDQLIGYTFKSYYEAAALELHSRAWWIAAWGPLMDLRGDLGRHQYLWAQQFTDGQVGPEPHAFAGIAGICDGSLINKRSLDLIERALGHAPLAR